MCQRIQCDDCGKPTYAGCGRHVEQVLGDVPEARRCTCRQERKAGDIERSSIWRRLFGG